MIFESLGAKIPTPPPPPPPALRNFPKAGTSTTKSNGPMMSTPMSNVPPPAPPMPSKLPYNVKSSAGLSKTALAAGRGGLKPVQGPNLNSKPTQLSGKPKPTETTASLDPINASVIMASRNSLKPVSQRASPPVVKPQSNQMSHKTSGATNDAGPGVKSLVKRFDNPEKTSGTPNELMSEFALMSQNRNKVRNINWEQFDKEARKS